MALQGQINTRLEIKGTGTGLGGSMGIYSHENSSGYNASNNRVGFSAQSNLETGFSSQLNSSGFVANANSNFGFHSTFNMDGFVASNNSNDGLVSTRNSGYAGFFTSPESRNEEAVYISHDRPTGLELKFGGFGRVGAEDSYVVYLNHGNGSVGTESFQIRDGTGIFNALIVHESGEATFSGPVCASNISCSSDFRYKKNVAPISNSLSNLSLIKGITYDWDQERWPDRKFSDNRQIGFIAQELEAVYPELVLTDEDGYKSVAYNKMTAVLVEAVKELNEMLEEKNKSLRLEIEERELENKRLKKIIAQIESRVSNLEKLE